MLENFNSLIKQSGGTVFKFSAILKTPQTKIYIFASTYINKKIDFVLIYE